MVPQVLAKLVQVVVEVAPTLVADHRIQVQSDLPLGHVIRHVPLILGVHICFWPGESPVNYPLKALQPKEGNHLGLPFLIIAPVKNGNVHGN